MSLKIKSRIRSTSHQLKMLTDYMQTHPRLAHGEFVGPQGRLVEKYEWEKLRAMLSEYGPDKSIYQWKVTWRDLRRKARYEGSVREAAIASGNVTELPALTEQASKILGILGTEGPWDKEETIDHSKPIFEESLMEVKPSNIVLEQCLTEVEHSNASYEPCLNKVEHSNGTYEQSLNEVEDPNASYEQSMNEVEHSYASFEQSMNEVEPPNASFEESLNESGQDSQPTEELLRPRIIHTTGSNHRTKFLTVSPIPRERWQRQRRPDPGPPRPSFWNQFLESKLQNNKILRDVSKQIAIANRHSAMHARLTYKDKLWRLRKDLFK